MVRSVQRYQLLVADDDRAFRETLRQIFEPYFSLIEAASGEEAVELIDRYRVDIALLDMYMQRLSGLDTLRHLKAVQPVRAPGILITADATDELRQIARKADAFSVLKKPVRKSDLVTSVSTALEFAYDDPDPFELASIGSG